MNYEAGGIAFIGCMFLGIGIGMLLDNTGAGALIGMGVGFLAMAIVGIMGRKA